MAAKTMRAVQYDKYGGGAAGLKHVEVPIPSPKKDEILLKLEAASINPVDWKIQKGMLRPFMPPKFPFIPVIDVAGEVIELGPGVSSFKAGDKVVGMLDFRSGGGLAEYAVASATLVTIRPPNLPPVEAAGLPAAAITALQSLKLAGIKFDGSDQRSNILITAASGGVGHFVVQLAKSVGLHVTATCGARNMKLVKDLGADEVLDYKTPVGQSLTSPSGVKYDSVVHCAPSNSIGWSVFQLNLSENGKVVDVTPTMKVIFNSLVKKLIFSKKKLIPLFLVPKREELEFIVELMKYGKLKTVIDSTHPLSKAGEAWTKSIEGHATGKIVVEM